MSQQMSAELSEMRPVSTGFYRPELDVLRFFAFFLVFLSHSIPLKEQSPHFLVAIRNAGAMGVPVFFALSAYLITELLLRERDYTGSIDIPLFYIRRILRIWPLYFLVLILGFGGSNLFPGMPIPWSAFAAYSLLVGNWWTVYHGFLPFGIATLWTVSVEEQFYLCWPSLLRHSSRRAVGTTSILLWLCCQACTIVLCYRGVIINPSVWASSLVNLQYFAIGALMSVVLKGRTPILSGPLRIGFVFVSLALFFIANEIFDTDSYVDNASLARTFPGYLIVGFGAALLIVATLGWCVPFRLKPFIYLGKISYGLYVYHVPCLLIVLFLGREVFHHHLSLLNWFIALPLSVLVSSLSYRYFETPFLRLKERFTIVKSRAI